ncbi:MAG: tRNA uridine-5-carboxymethylaminomethyl(34) synthesis GTPase MnmE [Candidatus Marinimicrobia bacterium]|nr:tRNA uridine-5-carboxymethylaminomethyl(34) synthesis GTPase MnmE [Candidatus Neomarinimicrobiota bacterium]
MTIFNYNDTIAAISTPPGVGGIAVIRLSGNDALSVALKALNIRKLKPRFAQFARISDPETSLVIDDVIVTYFKAPASYTGEDTVEISCHGGDAASPAILSLLYDFGARPALPGEFTRRAFMKGKMDLLQAEAVADLIHAVSTGGRKIATRALTGKLSKKISALRKELTDIASVLELELDFSEEEITPVSRRDVQKKISLAKNHIDLLARSYNSGKILREGALVPIVGRPNAGKSSLLNALLEEDRAIISHIPGTTRDTIEESFLHDGFLFRLVDTAGLRETEDHIEKIGTERARAILKNADLILLVLDLSLEDTYEFEKEFISRHRDTPLILVCNKIDLNNSLPETGAKNMIGVSATQSYYIDALLDQMLTTVQKHYHVDGNSVAITKQRHLRALRSSFDALIRADKALSEGLSNEFPALDIREAIHALDDITGETTSEDVLNNIFSRFCIGK